MSGTRRGNQIRRRRIGLAALGVILAGLMTGAVYENRIIGPLPLMVGQRPDAPAPLATWPWPQAVRDTPHPGVTHWLDRSSADGTTLDLFDFDFQANPHLRLELYDQDQDDDRPFDNRVRYWAQGVGQATRHLNQIGRGPVVAAWNGLFFQYTAMHGGGIASHVSPVVLGGRPLYTNGENHRWTFGVKYHNGRPVFKAIHLPGRVTLVREFDWAAGAAQDLIRNGSSQPLPALGRGKQSTFEQMKTSRVSLGWSRDSRHLYLLFVKEPDHETVSIWAWEHHIPLGGGWSLPDEQRFWQKQGAWGAVNSDAGNVAQLTYRLPDGRYVFLPPKWTAPEMRRTLAPNCAGAPPGGALMYFFVREGR